MPYQNDLSTLADVISPAYAAQQAGIQNDQANQEQAMKNQVYQQQMPALEKQPGLENVFKQAQTGLTQGQGMAAQATGLKDLATLPSGIQAGVAGNQAQLTADHAKQLGSLGQMAGQVAGIMDGVPQAARPAMMQQILKSNNIDPQSMGPLLSGDPDMLRQVSQKMIGMSSDFQTKSMEANTRGAYEENVAGISGASHLAATKELTQGRRDVADIQAEVKKATAGLGAVQQRLYAKVANNTATPEERDALNSINTTMQLTRAGSPFQAAITGTQVPGNVPPVPGTSKPSDQATMTNAAKQIWPNDDPSKYEYRTGSDGNIQRRAK